MGCIEVFEGVNKDGLRSASATRGEIQWRGRCPPPGAAARYSFGPVRPGSALILFSLHFFAQLGSRQACVALSGASVPDFTMQRIAEHMNRRNQGTPWFTVSMPSGEAKLHCP